MLLCALLVYGEKAQTAVGQANQSSSEQLISLRDVVQEGVIGDPNSLDWNDGQARISAVSPDGKWTAVVLRRGNADRLTNDADLLVYQTAGLLQKPKPEVVAHFASASNSQPLAYVHWLPDSETLVFAGTQGSQFTQVYMVKLRDKKVKQLTDEPRSLWYFDVTPSTDYLVTVREPALTPIAENRECLQSGCLVTQETFYAAQHGTMESSYPVIWHDLRSGKSRTLVPPDVADPDLVDCKDDLKGGLSPDGRFGIRLCKYRRYRWPAWWGDYTTYPKLQELLSAGINGYVRQLVLLDFVHERSRKLTSGPYLVTNFSTDSVPQWIDGGRRLILAGAMEPLDAVSGGERQLRASHYAVVTIDPDTLQVERIASLGTEVVGISAVTWDQSTETLTVQAKDKDNSPLPGQIYRRKDSQWIQEMRKVSAPRPSVAAEVSLVLRQSAIDRPRMFAVDKTGRENLVLDPTPWLADRKLGKVEAITWKSKDGREWQGGLYYPPDYVIGHRYPVVLQTHGFNPDQFSLSGYTRNFVAQPLAAHGIVVLQIAENTKGIVGAEQWPVVQAGYEAAIDHLSDNGLVDRSKVGMIGWSWSGPAIGYTLTHSSYPVTAAAFTDTADFGWWYYVMQGARHGEHEYGTPPFGKGLDVWRRMSASFNLDQLHTPMMMWTGGGVEGLWDWYAILRRLNKPVEYWALPDGGHEVFKVAERMRTNELLVDWFRFWLKGEEDSAANKSSQYLRWREMRKLDDSPQVR
jgi:dipeptidyl aminopeptidase/acylaminoacyl peptidase